MRAINAAVLRELAADLDMELARLSRLEQDIQMVKAAIAADSERANLFYENLTLKLHSFIRAVNESCS